MKAKLIGTLMVFIAGAMPASAVPCRHQVVVQQHHAVEVVTPVVQQIVVPVYGLIPLYQPAAYAVPAAPVQQAAPVSTDDLLREFIAEMRSFRQEMQASRTGIAAKQIEPKQAAPNVDAIIGVVRKNCAGCHGASANEKGGGLALFNADGTNNTQLTPDALKRVVRRVSSGSMPPAPAKLTDADKQMIVEAFKQ